MMDLNWTTKISLWSNLLLGRQVPICHYSGRHLPIYRGVYRDNPFLQPQNASRFSLQWHIILHRAFLFGCPVLKETSAHRGQVRPREVPNPSLCAYSRMMLDSSCCCVDPLVNAGNIKSHRTRTKRFDITAILLPFLFPAADLFIFLLLFLHHRMFKRCQSCFLAAGLSRHPSIHVEGLKECPRIQVRSISYELESIRLIYRWLHSIDIS